MASEQPIVRDEVERIPPSDDQMVRRRVLHQELAECPQLESREFYREVEHPVIGKIKVPAVLFNLSLTPYALTGPAPMLGQHNREIYVDGLGYTQEELCRLRQLNVI